MTCTLRNNPSLVEGNTKARYVKSCMGFCAHFPCDLLCRSICRRENCSKRSFKEDLNKHLTFINFSFRLLCIVIDFFLNNQPDALIIPILFCYKPLRVSGIFSAHHQEFSTVHSALVRFMQVLMTASKHSQDGTAVPSWLCLEAVIKTCMKLSSAECTVENSWWWAEKMPETSRVL
jgi:hypothetical protein